MTSLINSSLKRLQIQSTSVIKSISTTSSNQSLEPIISSTSSSVIPPASTVWRTGTQRSGVLARKHGMTCLWDADGIRQPVTVLQLDSVQVISSNSYPSTSTTPAHHSVIVGCSPRRAKTTNASLLGQFKKAGVKPKMRVVEFPVSEDAVVEAGSTFSAAHFVPGQHVDVQATTIGKGFQGVMKRHNFKGLRASHGVSVSHRSHGSTGQHQDPGRVFPGKKMAGRQGGNLVTTQNLLVHRVDLLHNVIYVHGCVPGPPGGYIRVTDALKKVQWKAGERERKSLNKEGEMLDGISGLPMPIGTKEMAKGWPREIEVGQKVVVSEKK